MASNNEKEENVEGKIVHEEKVPEKSGSATVTHKKEEDVVEAKGLVESKSTEKKQEDVTGDTKNKDEVAPSKEEMENPEVEVPIPHAQGEVPSEQPEPKPADVAPLQTQQKGCCVIL
ncbi:hypothetical protein CAEBREN_13960 [Caenorhabditis brenneri]|uniref:Uncharacterized protein n=1 Tax=Caenorhabditis brenneri TaxID=135651 RepID=G0PJY3_CAEBE|nr:hypothetical protein CAEBREN_13960 [Caenorhabditis brenneri]